MGDLLRDHEEHALGHQPIYLHQPEVVHGQLEEGSGHGVYIIGKVIAHEGVLQVVHHRHHLDGSVDLETHGEDHRGDEVGADEFLGAQVVLLVHGLDEDIPEVEVFPSDVEFVVLLELSKFVVLAEVSQLDYDLFHEVDPLPEGELRLADRLLGDHVGDVGQHLHHIPTIHLLGLAHAPPFPSGRVQLHV